MRSNVQNLGVQNGDHRKGKTATVIPTKQIIILIMRIKINNMKQQISMVGYCGTHSKELLCYSLFLFRLSLQFIAWRNCVEESFNYLTLTLTNSHLIAS